MEPVLGGPEEGIVSWMDLRRWRAEPDLGAQALRATIRDDLREAVAEAVAAGWSRAEIRDEVEEALLEALAE